MSALVLILRGLVYRWRTNLAVALGCALSTAVLVGSLGAGDSVRYSLRAIALQRLGAAAYALETGQRFVRPALAGDIAARLGLRGAALLAVRGTASARGGETRVSGVQVLGVDDAFWQFASARPAARPGEDEVLLNEPLALRLGVVPGDEVLLRLPSGSAMPGEAPLAVGGEVALRVTVGPLVSDRSLGSFSLRVSQVPPLNAFVSRDLLASLIGQPGKANMILLDGGDALEKADQALASAWRLEDAGLSLRRAGEAWELVCERVFLDPPVEEAALDAGGRGVLTYFVDRISLRDRGIVYSFVSSAGPPRLSSELGDGEIVLNTWASRELGAAAGDVVELEYRVPAAGERLSRRTQRLRVREVVAILPDDRTYMPGFPGLADVENCRDWNPGYAIDLRVITDRDEAYWQSYRGSPRAFVSLAAARRMWGNRFGRLTAVRFDGAGDAQAIAASIMSRLAPRSLGMSFVPVRETALAASRGGVDFGSLFLGLSLFLVASSLLLTALLFQLSVRQRTSDIGLLTALGFTRGRVRLLLLAEGALVSLAGGALGLPCGLAFHRGVIAGLQGVWHDAVRAPVILPYVSPLSLLVGFGCGVIASLAVIVVASVSMLLTAPARSLRGPGRTSSSRVARLVAAVGTVGAAAVLAAVRPPESFFAAGALLLAGLLAWAWLLTTRLARAGGPPTLLGLGIKNAARRRTRSLAVASLLACGLFVVIAVAANRHAAPDAEERSSGTGGFAFVADTAIAVVDDPGISVPGLEGARVVGLRVLEGDDASCLNLNHVREPTILGVEPSRLSGAFTFASFAAGHRPREPWSVLEQDPGPDTIPAVADQTVITWGLGLRLGDELEYRDERGATLKVRLVASLASSIFQGNLIVAESALLRHYPSLSGRRMFLVDAPRAARAPVEQALNRALARAGVTTVAAADRLAEFNSVESTYLAIFGLLGWLGMLIGTAGLAIVVARNAAESRNELAVLRAVGLGKGALIRLVLAEHLLPAGSGLACGVVASAVAVYPAASLRALPVGFLAGLTATIALSALGCVVAAAAASLGSPLTDALRNE